MEKEKLRLAYISMEGNASHWFNFRRKSSKNPSWNEFYMALTRRFRSLTSWQDWSKKGTTDRCISTGSKRTKNQAHLLSIYDFMLRLDKSSNYIKKDHICIFNNFFFFFSIISLLFRWNQISFVSCIDFIFTIWINPDAVIEILRFNSIFLFFSYSSIHNFMCFEMLVLESNSNS